MISYYIIRFTSLYIILHHVISHDTLYTVSYYIMLYHIYDTISFTGPITVRPVTGSFKARAGQQQRVGGVSTHQTVVWITVPTSVASNSLMHATVKIHKLNANIKHNRRKI